MADSRTSIERVSIASGGEHRSPAQTASALAGLELRARQIVDGFLAGGHRGPRRGTSAEFAEHRQYAPGDDLRYLDWKVYGKHDRYYLKQLEQETNFTCHLLLDTSESMRYRSEFTDRSKLEHAGLAAAALAWLVLRQQDLVGLTTLGATPAALARPSGQASHFHEIAAALESLDENRRFAVEQSADEDADEIQHSIHRWVETCERRSVVVLLSDCFGPLEQTISALRHVRSRRHDLVLLHVIDPAEQDFPFHETTLFHDVESTQTQLVDCRRLRDAYRAEFDSFRRKLEAGCRDAGADYTLLRTDEPVAAALAAFLSARARRGTHA